MQLVSALASGINGAASGTATIYKRGTTTKATLYGDFAGTTTLTNPVTLDANGGATVYTEEYTDVAVSDSSGTSVRSFTDGVSASAVELKSTAFTGTDYQTAIAAASEPVDLKTALDKLFTSLGALDGNVLFNSASTAIQTALGTIGNAYINVQDSPYNAKGDGATDDRAAIISALAAADGRTLYFPGGTYLVSQSITVDEENIRILGDGMGSTIIRNTGTSQSSIFTFDPTTAGRYVIEGVAFESSQTMSTYVLRINDAEIESVLIKDCLFDDADFTGDFISISTSVTDMASITVRDCEFVMHPSAGSAIFSNVTDMTGMRVLVSGCEFDVQDTYADTIIQGRGFQVEGCTFDGTANTSNAFNAIQPSTTGFHLGSVTGCRFLQSSSNDRMTCFNLSSAKEESRFSESGNIFHGFEVSAVTGTAGLYSFSFDGSDTGTNMQMHLGGRMGRALVLTGSFSGTLTMTCFLEYDSVTLYETSGTTAASMDIAADLMPPGCNFQLMFHNLGAGTKSVDMESNGNTLGTITLDNTGIAAWHGGMLATGGPGVLKGWAFGMHNSANAQPGAILET